MKKVETILYPSPINRSNEKNNSEMVTFPKTGHIVEETRENDRSGSHSTNKTWQA